MNLLLYARDQNGSGKQLRRAVETVFPLNHIEICRTFEVLSGRLHQPRNGLEIAVLYAVDTADLTNLVSLQNVLEDFRIILIVPDNERDTISQAHTLRPRFLTYAGGNFEDVAMVLAKMIENLKSSNTLIRSEEGIND
ncbi:MAG: hypothetical protein H8E17_07875 [Deltaproteobacteria bacterium]|nr:hypothetical protein [Deltaproteobacteria bacterium]